MHFALVFYPQLDSELSEAIGRLRRKYDPTADHSEPHITIVFPVPDTVGETELISHVEEILGDREPFEIELGGFHKSRDHWLFLTLAAGALEAKELNRSLYTGILGKYGREDIDFVPHLGLGLFVKEGARYSWNHPRAADLDQGKYEQALQEARALPQASSCVVDRLHLVKIPDEVLEWTTGERTTLPEDWRSTVVRVFRLGDRGA
jgi:2'-5' RNA ligase